MTVSCGAGGVTPALASSGLSARVRIRSAKAVIIWRRSGRAAAPSDGTTRIQHSRTLGSSSTPPIHASIAWRTCACHGERGFTAAAMRATV